VRRYVVGALVLAVAAAAGASVYTAYARDQEYVRLIGTGDEAAGGDRPFQALEAYSGAIAVRPDSMVAHLKRGLVYRSRGDLDEALRDLRRASELDPTATRPAELTGDVYMSLERFDLAAARYEAFLALDDRAPRVWYKLGLARYRAGLQTEAIEPLRRALALDSRLAEANLALGLALRDRGELKAARASLETAAQLAPALTAPREALAALYLASGENARGIDQLEALAALDPSSPDRVIAVGMAHARSRRFDAAVLALSRAVERFPDEPRVYAALGNVWLETAEVRGDEVALKKAVQALTTAASHPAVTSAALTDLGRAWLVSGDAAAAERALRQAVERLPVEPEAFLQLATLSRRAGRMGEARDALIRYATLVDDTEPLATVATQIATYSLSLGDPPVALRWIDRAIADGGRTPARDEIRARARAAMTPR
jgi:tetratricopeptide (TPR) repeat protein